MKRRNVSDLERGTRNPSVRALGRLAEALKLDPQQLLERDRSLSSRKLLSLKSFGARFWDAMM